MTPAGRCVDIDLGTPVQIDMLIRCAAAYSAKSQHERKYLLMRDSRCVMKILEIAQRQQVQKDGRKYSRFVVIRNTYPELTTTTIKSWHHWVPADIGNWRGQGPPTHHIRDEGIDMEVIFVSLDRPKDLAKVLGMEVTGAWINEAREVDKALIDGLTGRVGRFRPPKTVERDDWECVGAQILMDTNPPDKSLVVRARRAGPHTPRNEALCKSVTDAEEEMRKTIVNGKPLLGRDQKPSSSLRNRMQIALTRRTCKSARGLLPADLRR